MRLETINKKHLAILIAFGFLTALTFISYIILSVNEPKPEWSEFWYIKPLVITPIAGAFGGVSSYLINIISIQNGFLKLLRIIFSVLVFIFFIWIGTVLGLDGTLWN